MLIYIERTIAHKVVFNPDPLNSCGFFFNSRFSPYYLPCTFEPKVFKKSSLVQFFKLNDGYVYNLKIFLQGPFAFIHTYDRGTKHKKQLEKKSIYILRDFKIKFCSVFLYAWC